jgi:P4 family phage/plasmid primase-like protien
LDEIGLLNPGDPHLQDKIDHYLKQGFEMGVLATDEIKKAICKSLGYRVKLIDTMERNLRKQMIIEAKAEDARNHFQSNNPDLLVAQSVLTNHFANGERLIHAFNQQFYHYDTTHWKPLAPNILTRIVFTEAERLKAQSLSLDYKTVPLIPRVEVILKAKRAQHADLLGFTDCPKPIYNTLNTEIHLDPTTGSTTLVPHSPSSYLINCLDTVYDPGAPTPLFDRFLDDLFSPLSDSSAAISTIEEVLGYAIQPYKPIPLIVLLKGSGSNGKTSLLDVVTSLVGGDNILPRSVLEFANTGKNNHALASLPGKLILLDDDMGTEIRLPASALKKLSENKLLEANPKGLPTYNFVNTATPVILTNNNPQIPDLSRGLQRRLVVVPFNRCFKPHEQDSKFVQSIIDTERPGIFNRLLQGAQRLFKRGCLSLSTELQAAVDQVTAAGNQLRRFLFEATRPNQTQSTPVIDLYTHYKEWAIHSYGTSRPYNRAMFEAQLASADYVVHSDPDTGARLVEGLVPWSPDSVPDNVVPMQQGGA